jgi:hypothetical protein
VADHPADAVHRQEALPGVGVGKAGQASHEFTACEPELLDEWVGHSVTLLCAIPGSGETRDPGARAVRVRDLKGSLIDRALAHASHLQEQGAAAAARPYSTGGRTSPLRGEGQI